MIIFFMSARYSSDHLKAKSPATLRRVEGLIKKFGGQIESMYSVLGEKDILLISTFPGVEQALKASAALSKITGISFSAVPAVPVKDFSQLIAH